MEVSGHRARTLTKFAKAAVKYLDVITVDTIYSAQDEKSRLLVFQLFLYFVPLIGGCHEFKSDPMTVQT